MADLFELKATLSLDTSEYESQIDDAVSQADQLTDSLNEASDAADEASDTLTDTGDSADSLSDAAADLASQMDGAADSGNSLSDSLTETLSAEDGATGGADSLGGALKNLVSDLMSGNLSITSFVDVLKNMDAGMALAATTALGLVKAVADLTSDVSASGDAIAKNAQKMGVSSGFYQRWDYIAQHCGTSADTLKTSMRTLTSAAQTGSDAFLELGMSLDEVASMSQEDLFESTITALQSMESGSERAYIAQKLLGRGAQELAPLLNMTAQETANLGGTIESLGGVMEGDQLKSSEAFQDALTDLATASQGFKARIAGAFQDIGTAAVLMAATAIGAINNLIDWLGSLDDVEPKSLEQMAEAAAAAQADLDALNAEIAATPALAEVYAAQMENDRVIIEQYATACEEAAAAEAAVGNSAADHTAEIAEFTNALTGYSESVANYFGVFDAVGEQTSTTVGEMTDNIRGQIEWNNQYSQSLQTIAESGIEGVDGLLASLSSMGEQGASFALAIADAINEGDVTAVNNLITQMNALADSQSQLAANLAASATGQFEAMGLAGEAAVAAVEAALDALDGKTVTTTIVVNTSGGGASAIRGGAARHAGGLDSVPYNDYPALLHRNERVLTAEENEEYTKNGRSGGNNVTNNFYPQSMSQAQMDYIARQINAQLGGAIA